METAQERFDRLLAEQRAEGRAQGLAEAKAAGMVEGILGSFRRGLAVSGLNRRLVEDVEAHADRIVEAAWRGTHFDLDDIPDGGRLLATVQEGGDPAQVPAERIWALLPPVPKDDTVPR
ncbi:MAG: hypothetical protein F4Y08_10140 [Caldilineaceae bacterium SB0662_bin_9]|uniref:Uncharacterized protein n=1 Tax=Caldilineaceae bacterium SB0662_bin_9 TaxID=2605258 RepID=A0A6B1DUE6_9CHLR|nr:hypothetical protein [Caldilineaceae bacterium]MYD90677.1 hypothetical protein [Caldilineaceae bacterium SB0662_bin_9]